jgi:hypothetical protein
MSIVILKRSSSRFQKRVSSGVTNFSLNGGYRNQRSIGNTNLAALSNSNYNLCNANDPTIIKKSSKSTKGHLYSSLCDYNNPCGSGINNMGWVKNFSPEDHSAGEHIVNKVLVESANCVNNINHNSNDSTICCKERSYHIGGKRFYTVNNTKKIDEFLKVKGAVSSGDYLRAGLLLNKKYDSSCNTTIESISHSPKSLLNSGCYHC